MKRLLQFSLISLLLIYSCSNNQGKSNAENDTISSVNQSQVAENDQLFQSLEGSWYYTNFIDSTIINKNICSFINSVAIEGYEITFSKEMDGTILWKGLNNDHVSKIKKMSSSAYIFEDCNMDCDSIIVLKKDAQWIINYKKRFYVASKQKVDWVDHFYYRKKAKIDDIEKYFAKYMFAGSYLDVDRNKTVFFREDLSLMGFDSITNYHILIGDNKYPNYKNLDKIVLGKEYYCEFTGDTLILSESIYFKGEYGMEPYRGDVKYRLVKQKQTVTK